MKLLTTLLILFLYTPIYSLDLDSLLIISIGGPKGLESLKNVSTMKTTGTVTMSGISGSFEQIIQLPNQYRLSLMFPGFTITQGFDGVNAWQVGMNGQVSEINGSERNDLLTSVYLSTYQYILLDTLHQTTHYIKDTTFNNTQYHIIEFTPLSDDTIFAYYNQETGYRDYYVGDLDFVNTENYESDYRLVSNIPISFKSSTIVKANNFSAIMSIDSCEFNKPVDRSMFLKPGTEQTDFHFPQDKLSVTIDMNYTNGHIRLPVVINGKKKVMMILDSGAASNIFNASSVEQFKLQSKGSLPAVGVGGFDEVSLVKIDSIQIGELSLYNQIAGTMDLSEIEDIFKSEQPFGGVLGYDFISRFPIAVDYVKNELTVYNPDKFSPPPGGTVIDFQLTMLAPTVAATICGIEGKFIVDLGNSFGLIIHRQFAKENKLEQKLTDIGKAPGYIGGVGGMMISKKATAKDFQIGTIDLQNIDVLLPDSTAGISGSQSIAGNIGNRLLDHYTVLFDYDKNELILYNINE